MPVLSPHLSNSDCNITRRYYSIPAPALAVSFAATTVTVGFSRNQVQLLIFHAMKYLFCALWCASGHADVWSYTWLFGAVWILLFFSATLCTTTLMFGWVQTFCKVILMSFLSCSLVLVLNSTDLRTEQRYNQHSLCDNSLITPKIYPFSKFCVMTCFATVPNL